MRDLHVHLHLPAPAHPDAGPGRHHQHDSSGEKGRPCARPTPAATPTVPRSAHRSDRPTDADRAQARRLAALLEEALATADPNWGTLDGLVHETAGLAGLRTGDPDLKALRRLREAADQVAQALWAGSVAEKSRRKALLNQQLRAAGVGSLDNLSVAALLEHDHLRIEALLLATDRLHGDWPTPGRLFKFLGKPADFDTCAGQLYGPFGHDLDGSREWARLCTIDVAAPVLTAAQALEFIADPLAAMSKHACSLAGNKAPTPIAATRQALARARLTPREVTDVLPRLAQRSPMRVDDRGYLVWPADHDPANSALFRAGAVLYYQSATRGNFKLAAELGRHLPRLWSDMVSEVLYRDGGPAYETLCAYRRALTEKTAATGR